MWGQPAYCLDLEEPGPYPVGPLHAGGFGADYSGYGYVNGAQGFAGGEAYKAGPAVPGRVYGGRGPGNAGGGGGGGGKSQGKGGRGKGRKNQDDRVPGGGRGGGGKSSSHALPQAKYINMVICKAADRGDMQSLLNLVAAQHAEMSCVNLSTAMHKLARFAKEDGKWSLSPSDVRFATLHAQTRTELERQLHNRISDGGRPIGQDDSLPRCWSTVAWAYGTLQIHGLDVTPIFRVIGQLALEHLPTFKPLELTNLLWGFAKVKVSDTALFQAASKHILADLTPYSSSNLSTLIWAMVTAQQHEPDVVQRVVEEFALRLRTAEVKPVELTNLMWGLATAKLHPKAHVLFEVGARALQLLPEFKLQELSITCWAFSRLHARYDRLFAGAAMHLCSSPALLQQIHPQGMANLLWAFEKQTAMGSAAAEQLLAALAALVPRCLMLLKQLKPQEFACVFRALARMGLRWGGNHEADVLFVSAAGVGLMLLRRLSAPQCIDLLSAFSTFLQASGGVRLPEVFPAFLEALAQRCLDNVAELGHSGAMHLVEVAAAAVDLLGEQRDRLVSILARLVLRLKPERFSATGQKLLASLCGLSVEELDPSDLRNALSYLAMEGADPQTAAAGLTGAGGEWHPRNMKSGVSQQQEDPFEETWMTGDIGSDGHSVHGEDDDELNHRPDLAAFVASGQGHGPPGNWSGPPEKSRSRMSSARAASFARDDAGFVARGASGSNLAAPADEAASSPGIGVTGPGQDDLVAAGATGPTVLFDPDSGSFDTAGSAGRPLPRSVVVKNTFIEAADDGSHNFANRFRSEPARQLPRAQGSDFGSNSSSQILETRASVPQQRYGIPGSSGHPIVVEPLSAARFGSAGSLGRTTGVEPLAAGRFGSTGSVGRATVVDPGQWFGSGGSCKGPAAQLYSSGGLSGTTLAEGATPTSGTVSSAPASSAGVAPPGLRGQQIGVMASLIEILRTPGGLGAPGVSKAAPSSAGARPVSEAAPTPPPRASAAARAAGVGVPRLAPMPETSAGGEEADGDGSLGAQQPLDADPSAYIVKNTFIELAGAEDASLAASVGRFSSEPPKRVTGEAASSDGAGTDLLAESLVRAAMEILRGGAAQLRAPAATPTAAAAAAGPAEAPGEACWRKGEPAYIRRTPLEGGPGSPSPKQPQLPPTPEGQHEGEGDALPHLPGSSSYQ